jgi:hypothetical protein
MMAMAEVKAVMHEEAHGADEPAPPAPEDVVVDEAGDPAKVAGILVEFPGPERLKSAAKEVRAAGYRKWDCFSPFPVHGLDRAMGIRRTILPVAAFKGGLVGALLAVGLQWFTNAYDYPFLISGKPYFSLPANIPVAFELTVLLAAFGAFFGMLLLNGLPQFFHPVFTSDRFRRATADRFFVFLDAKDREFRLQASTEFAKRIGGTHVTVLEV